MANVLNALLWVAAVVFALILGGNLYEQLVIVGRWADDPPASLVFWAEIMESGHFHFYLLTPAALLISLVLIPFGWRQPVVRRDVIIAAGSIVLVLAITFLWAIPILGGLFPKQVLGSKVAAGLPPKSPGELMQLIADFKVLSTVRWLVLLAGFLSLLHALRESKRPAA